MATSFTITTPTSEVFIDDQGNGIAVYNVFNNKGKLVRGRSVLETDPPDQPHLRWLALEGDQERDFGVNETDSFKVHVAVPQGTGPGSYLFRINMLDVESPDDGFVRGPFVTVTIPGGDEEINKILIVPWFVWVLLTVAILDFLSVLLTFLLIVLSNNIELAPGILVGVVGFDIVLLILSGIIGIFLFFRIYKLQSSENLKSFLFSRWNS